MGKYTDLARKYLDGPQVEGVVVYNKSVNINNIKKAISSNAGTLRSEGVTSLRPTTLTTLLPPEEEVWVAAEPDRCRYTNLYRKGEGASVRCIHDMPSDECAVCSGYARWLIEDEGRLRRAQADPEGVRREFWRTGRGDA